MTEKKIKNIYKYKYIWNIFFIYFFILYIYLFIFIIIFRYAIAYLRTGSYAPGVAYFPYPRAISSLVKTSMISLISSLSHKLYINSLVFYRNIFGSSSIVFVIFGNLRKPSESNRNSSENRPAKHVSSKIWILCSRDKNNISLARLRSLVSYCSCHSKLISSRHRVISSIYQKFYWNTVDTVWLFLF